MGANASMQAATDISNITTQVMTKIQNTTTTSSNTITTLLQDITINAKVDPVCLQICKGSPSCLTTCYSPGNCVPTCGSGNISCVDVNQTGSISVNNNLTSSSQNTATISSQLQSALSAYASGVTDQKNTGLNLGQANIASIKSYVNTNLSNIVNTSVNNAINNYLKTNTTGTQIQTVNVGSISCPANGTHNQFSQDVAIKVVATATSNAIIADLQTNNIISTSTTAATATTTQSNEGLSLGGIIIVIIIIIGIVLYGGYSALSSNMVYIICLIIAVVVVLLNIYVFKKIKDNSSLPAEEEELVNGVSNKVIEIGLVAGDVFVFILLMFVIYKTYKKGSLVRRTASQEQFLGTFQQRATQREYVPEQQITHVGGFLRNIIDREN